MTAPTQSSGHETMSGANRELARARTMRALSIALAVAAFATLVVGFGLGWPAYYQVPAGLAAYAAIEWQRNRGRKIKALKESGAA